MNASLSEKLTGWCYVLLAFALAWGGLSMRNSGWWMAPPLIAMVFSGFCAWHHLVPKSITKPTVSPEAEEVIS